MSEIYHGRGYVYSLQYHIVWCVKHRRNVLDKQINDDLKSIIKEIADEYDVKILEMDIDQDNVHLLIECKPQHYIPDIIKVFKGISAKRLFENHPKLREKLFDKHLWSPSYFVVTASQDVDNQIIEYMNSQIKKDNQSQKNKNISLYSAS